MWVVARVAGDMNLQLPTSAANMAACHVVLCARSCVGHVVLQPSFVTRPLSSALPKRCDPGLYVSFTVSNGVGVHVGTGDLLGSLTCPDDCPAPSRGIFVVNSCSATPPDASACLSDNADPNTCLYGSPPNCQPCPDNSMCKDGTMWLRVCWLLCDGVRSLSHLARGDALVVMRVRRIVCGGRCAEARLWRDSTSVIVSRCAATFARMWF